MARPGLKFLNTLADAMGLDDNVFRIEINASISDFPEVVVYRWLREDKDVIAVINHYTLVERVDPSGGPLQQYELADFVENGGAK